jgi:hypothetical protein
VQRPDKKNEGRGRRYYKRRVKTAAKPKLKTNKPQQTNKQTNTKENAQAPLIPNIPSFFACCCCLVSRHHHVA